jgi:uncharacterized protein with HEPN domain
MVAAIDRLSELVSRTDRETFDRDWVVQDAFIRELEVPGEAPGRLSSAFTAEHPEIPWREITGMRHKLIHDYFGVDLGVVWRTATATSLRSRPRCVRRQVDLLGGQNEGRSNPGLNLAA